MIQSYAHELLGDSHGVAIEGFGEIGPQSGTRGNVKKTSMEIMNDALRVLLLLRNAGEMKQRT